MVPRSYCGDIIFRGFIITIVALACCKAEDLFMQNAGNDRYQNIMKQTCKVYPADDACGEIPPMNETRAAAETFYFADVRAKAAANAGTWFGSIFRTAAASHAKKMREKCQKNRLAIFVGGGSGSGKDALERKWRSLTDKIEADCGFVRINFNNMVTGAGNFTAGQIAWKRAFHKYGQCAMWQYGGKRGIGKWANEFVEKAIDEGHSFVYDGTMSNKEKFGEDWKQRIAKLNTTLPGYPHTVYFFGTSSDMADSAIRLWNRGIGRLPPGIDAEIGVFVALCFIYNSHVKFAKYFIDDFSKWDNVELYHKAAETDYKLSIMFRKVKGQELHGGVNDKLYAKFLKIAETTPYEFEKAIKDSPEGKKRNILQRYKEQNRDCDFCVCDVYSFAMSERSKAPANLTGDGDATGFNTCYDRRTIDTDCASRTTDCASTDAIFKCPKLCGLCYDLNSGKCNVSQSLDSSLDATKNEGIIAGIANSFWQFKSRLTSAAPSNPQLPASGDSEMVFQPSITDGEIYLSFFLTPGEVSDTMQSLWNKLKNDGYKMWQYKSAITSTVIGLGAGTYSAGQMASATDSVSQTANAVDKSVLVIIGVTKAYLTDYHKSLELQYILMLRKPFVIVTLENSDTVKDQDLFKAFDKNVGKFQLNGDGVLDSNWPPLKAEIDKLLAKFGLNAKKS